MNTWREKARVIIADVILETHGFPRKEIRKALREAYPRFADQRAGYAYKAWCDEVAYALRERSRRPGSRHPHKPKAASEIMPSMREWAMLRGQAEVTAVLDVDLMESPPRKQKTISTYQLNA